MLLANENSDGAVFIGLIFVVFLFVGLIGNPDPV